MPPMPILIPMLTLVLWSFVMLAWLYVVRIPAIARLKIKFDPLRPAGELLRQLPPQAQWKADNYNHLMEQPTLFYAVCLALAVLGQGWGLNEILAWAYVVLRIVHSLIQATVNIVGRRFAVFTVASLVLLAMTVRAFLAALA